VRRAFLAIVLGLAVLVSSTTHAQAPAPAKPEAPKTARQAAPIDLTGNWVSVVSEDWRWRMVTPLKGDAASVPINQEARKIVDAWDPAKDEAAGLQCKAYGAPAVMRIPGRLRISWQDENTIKIETDAGLQNRVFHFGAREPATGAPTWQGYSAAKWEAGQAPQVGPGLTFGLGRREGTRSRSLEVVTTRLRAGYLRKNGVPYSDRASLTEYYDRFSEPGGDEWLTVTTIVEDPVYLYMAFVTTTDFKREADGSKWHPFPCSAR
jgi:hypothetical protein